MLRWEQNKFSYLLYQKSLKIKRLYAHEVSRKCAKNQPPLGKGG